MRNTIITLSLFAFIASSCGQTTKKQTEENINVAYTSTTANNIDSIEVQNISNNQLFDIREIDSVKYFALKKNADIQKVDWEKITDLEQAKKILKGRVIWGEYNEENGKMQENKQGDIVYKIVFRNGKITSYDYPEVGFIAYFPQEDILSLEGGHSSSMIFNLTTGEETEDVGDPEYRRYSPAKQYRFNGYYSGQADIYFIQKKSGTKYKTIIELDYSLDSELATQIGFIPEYLSDVFWQNDTTMNFVAPRYFYPEDKTEKFYYQLILK